MPTGAISWDTCRVFGTWHNQDGSLKAGKYRIAIPNRVGNKSGGENIVIPAGMFATGDLNILLGKRSLDLDIPASNDPDNSPVDWGKPIITITFADGAASETYVIDTPVGGQVDLATVVLPATTPTQAPFLVLGVPGGAARLSADGQSVLDADGDPITSSGGGTGPVASGNITDATTVGKAVLTAADPATARSALGVILGTAAAKDATAFASAGQGTKADTAVQPADLQAIATAIPTTAAQVGAATAAQGTKADAAVPQAVATGAAAVRYVGYGTTLPSAGQDGDLFILVGT